MEKQTNNNTIEISISDLWKVLRRCWWVLLAVAVIISGMTYLFLDRTHVDEYKSTTTLYLLRTDGRTQSNYQDAAFAAAIVSDIDTLILSEDNVIVPAIKKLAGTVYTESELRARINAILQKVTVKTGGTDSRTIYITVTSATAEGAAKVANAVSLAATEYLNEMLGSGVVNIVDGAKAPKAISNPISPLKVGAVGLAAALLVYLIWLVLYLVDDKIETEDNVEKRLGLTVLGSIPYMGPGGKRNKKRYGSYYGYYGYGYGYQQIAKNASGEEKKEAQK